MNKRDNLGNTPLTCAVSAGDIKLIKHLIQLGADMNAIDKHGDTPLTFAVSTGDIKFIKHLTQLGADVNKRDELGNTPLTCAVSAGDIKLIKHLIQLGADMNTIDSRGNTPLINAISARYTDLIKHLLKLGADVNISGSLGDTALMLASESDDVNVLKMLIEAGADVNYVKDRGSNKTALSCVIHSVAPESTKVEIIQLLLEAGADVNAGRQSYPGLMNEMLLRTEGFFEPFIRTVGVNAKDKFGFPLISLATREEYGRALPSLIREGADVNALDRFGNTALHIINNRVKGCLLLAAGAKINVFNDEEHNALRSYIFWGKARALDYRMRRVHKYSPEYKEPLKENVCMLLYAAGETLDGATVEGKYFSDHMTMPIAQCVLFEATGPRIVVNNTFTVPEYLLFKDLELSLKHLVQRGNKKLSAGCGSALKPVRSDPTAGASEVIGFLHSVQPVTRG